MDQLTISNPKQYKIDFNKLENSFNVEYTLLKILFEEMPILLNEETVEKYGLGDSVIEVK